MTGTLRNLEECKTSVRLVIREDFTAEDRSGLQNIPSRRPVISLGGRGRPWFSEEEAKHKGENEQGLFRQQRLDWPVRKVDSAGLTGVRPEEAWEEHGTPADS